MKSIITLLSTAAVLAAVVVTSGFALDAAVVIAIGAAAGLASLFVRDYSRAPRYDLDAPQATAPQATARQGRRVRRSEAGVEFATFATFNTTIG